MVLEIAARGATQHQEIRSNAYLLSSGIAGAVAPDSHDHLER
jgi:hypothetical protein